MSGSNEHNNPGILYLIPSSLGEKEISTIWPGNNANIVNNLDLFIVENLRTARRFLRYAGYSRPFEQVCFHEIGKHSDPGRYPSFLKEVASGRDAGLLSEAGTPCIADPGHIIVALAHRQGIRVRPLVRPNSILLALMASGLNGQEFSFHGYLPVNKDERIKKIREIEEYSRQGGGSTHIFMETPYRNMAIAETLLKECRPGTWLCIAADLCMHSEYIRTQTIAGWRKEGLPGLHKRPAMFLISVEK